MCPADGSLLVNSLPLSDTLPDGAPASRAREVTDPLVGGTLAGRFRITRRIGEGGMGVVYEAVHALIGRPVALKVLHERYVERPEVAARLMNEARLASSIRNEHIVDIFDFGETADGRTFVVMELLDGASLAQVIRSEGPLSEARAVSICMQVADALGAAHERGIIHRDVKPENVFLAPRDGADFAKVLDFGISKTVRVGDGAEAERLTQTGVVLGTPMYMSPEQARGEDGIDQRIDVYALGVILYECLTGELPFRGSNYLGIISDVLNRTPAPPREVRPDLGISRAAEQVVLRAMAKDREARYPSMSELGADLRRVLAGEPLLTGPATPQPAPGRARRPLAAYAILGALAAAVVLVAVVVASRAAPVPSRPATVAAAAPVVAAPQQPQQQPPPAPPTTVIVKISSNPPGAEIRNGDRKLGVTSALGPSAIELARSDRPVHLTFRLAGYEDGATDVVPEIDGEPINIELHAAKKPPHRHRDRPTAKQAVGEDHAPAPSPFLKKHP
jgi:serine/threonine-protein kinase